MTEFSPGFAKELIDVAWTILSKGADSLDAKRAVLYLSKVSAEISLKHYLERSGFSVAELRSLGHDLAALHEACAHTTFQKPLSSDQSITMSGAELGAVVLDVRYGNATVGTLLDAEKAGATKYPSQLRYGRSLKDYPPEMVLQAATVLHSWVLENACTAKRRNGPKK